MPVQVWIDGALYQTIWTSFQVDVYEALPVLVRDLRRGEWLAPNAVEMRRVRTTNALAGAPLASEAIAGALALRDMPAGTVLTDRDVQRARLVRQGDTVQLQVKKGAITARSTAIAKQDGAIGDRIRVTTNDRNLEITAVIVGRELVEVDLSRASVNFTASGSQPTDAIALARSNAR